MVLHFLVVYTVIGLVGFGEVGTWAFGPGRRSHRPLLVTGTVTIFGQSG